MHTQQGPPVWHRELFSVLCGSLDGSGVWGRVDTCIHMAESLHYSPETITTLLFGHTPTQNKKFLKREREAMAVVKEVKDGRGLAPCQCCC